MHSFVVLYALVYPSYIVCIAFMSIERISLISLHRTLWIMLIAVEQGFATHFTHVWQHARNLFIIHDDTKSHQF